MIKRLISALIALPVALALVVAGGWPFVGLAAFAVGACLYEWMSMALPDDRLAQVVAGTAGMAFFATIATGQAFELVGLVGLQLGLVGLLVFFLLRTGEMSTVASRMGLVLLGIGWIGGLFGGLAGLRFLPHGDAWLILAFFIAFGSDTGGYFAGKYLGKKKLYEKVSPKKTWAGAVGGAFASVLASVLLKVIWKQPEALDLAPLVPLVFVSAAVGQMGDLCQSLIKRSVGVKDSGSIMPGHGGLFDRVDALLFVGVCLFAYAVLVLGEKPVWFSLS